MVYLFIYNNVSVGDSTHNKVIFRELSPTYLSFIDLERGVFGEILPEVIIFPEGWEKLCKNIKCFLSGRPF